MTKVRLNLSKKGLNSLITQRMNAWVRYTLFKYPLNKQAQQSKFLNLKKKVKSLDFQNKIKKSRKKSSNLMNLHFIFTKMMIQNLTTWSQSSIRYLSKWNIKFENLILTTEWINFKEIRIMKILQFEHQMSYCPALSKQIKVGSVRFLLLQDLIKQLNFQISFESC